MESSKNRRKSSVFRKLLSVDETSENNISPKVDRKDDDIILEHILEMEKETADWISYYRKIKSKFQELDKYKDDVNVVSWAQCEKDLTEEDKNFLSLRPDYRATIKRLDEMATKIHLLQVSNYRMKVISKNDVTRISRSVNEIKQNLCDYLLAYDESDSLISLDC